jgi:hypothetical protein
MPTELWILIGVGVLFFAGLIIFIVLQVAQGKRDFSKIDYSKIRRWKDDDW